MCRAPVSRRAPRSLRATLPVLLAGLLLLLILVGASATNAPALPAAVTYDPAVAAILSQITTQTLAVDLAGLTGARPVTVAGSLVTITTRYSYQSEVISLATRYATEQFAGYGLAVAYHDYVYNGNPWRNVVAEKPGVVNPGEIYLITAHLDDKPDGPLAPGADDNGSGSVAVLTAARLLAARHLAYTVRFILFTGEEQGLRGSAMYAADCQAQGEDIRGVVNLDMLGSNTGEPVFDAYALSGADPGAPESRQLAQVFSDVVGIYDLDLIPRLIYTDTYPLVSGSDQWSFLSRGYPAILVIEDYAGGDFTPFYHTISDTLSTLDLDYDADLTRAAVATLAHLSRVIPGMGSLSGTVRALDTGHALSATVIVPAPAYDYTFTAATGAAGVYSLSLPVGGYTLTVAPAASGTYPATTHVAVITDAVTVQDVALAPWPRWYLPFILKTTL